VKYTNTIKCKTILSKSRIPGIDFGINPYTGCGHKCQYCYAVFMKKFTGHTEPWGDFVDVKINAPEVLVQQLHKLKGPRTITFGTVCDAYQPLEKKYKITRRCLEVLSKHNHTVTILTKSSLVLRDLDILKKLHNTRVSFTITSLNPLVRKVFEPGTSPPIQRFQALKILAEHRIPTRIFCAPVLPGITDSQRDIDALMWNSWQSGTRCIMFDTLNPYPKVWRNVLRLAKKHFPSSLKTLHHYHTYPRQYNRRLRLLVAQSAAKHNMEYTFIPPC
jgi:DNA repair photolyase